MKGQGQQQQSQAMRVRQSYSRLIYMGLGAHMVYCICFFALGLQFMGWYNVGSSLFYCVALWQARRGSLRVLATAVHMEIALFAVVGTLCLGWSAGLWLYLVAISSLVYFCPFEHFYVPYIFSVGHGLIFIGLWAITLRADPLTPLGQQAVMPYLFLTSGLAAFVIIICAALASDLSARVSSRQLRDENRDLFRQASYDQLTGLLSRRSFLQRMQEVSQPTIALGDIDNFKQINDSYGHGCGDYILHQIARIMEKQCPEATICRWGGEEFVLLFGEILPQQVRESLEGLRQGVADAMFDFQGHQVAVTLTLGVATPGECDSAFAMIDLADQRLYWGKGRGKNQVVFGEDMKRGRALTQEQNAQKESSENGQ